MKILLINHYAGSKNHGMEFRPFYMAREWVRAGHKVQIVAASYSHVRSKQPDTNETVLNEVIDGVNYRWYPTPAYSGNGLGRVKNILGFILQLWKDSKSLVEKFNPDLVISSSTYPMDIWPARRIAKLSNAKLVFEVHDLWPLSPIELGGMSKWHPFIMWVQLSEDYAYKHSDKVVSMLPKALPYMQSRGMDSRKFVYIPNGISMDEWLESKSTALRDDVSVALSDARIAGEHVLAYAGSHGLPNALDNLLDAADILRDEPVRFILVGKGHERERLIQRIKTEKLNRVKMFEALPKEQIPSFLASVDMAYLGAPSNPIYRFGVSPNKMIDYMMAGVPILYAIEAGNDPVSEADCGISLPAQNSQALADAILRLIKMPVPRLQSYRDNGIRYAKAHHNYEFLARSFVDQVSQENIC